MFCVGLTGNIGSGKSTVAAYFQQLGIDIINADKLSRALTKPGEPAFKLIQEHFGEQVINQQGELNRQILRKIIFDSKAERLWLENLLHPLIRQSIIKEITKVQSPYCIIEIPLLLTRDDYPYLDRVLVLTASLDLQIERIIKRDQCSVEEAKRILASQPLEKNRLEIADDVLINSGSLASLSSSVKKLHTKYLHLANEKSS